MRMTCQEGDFVGVARNMIYSYFTQSSGSCSVQIHRYYLEKLILSFVVILLSIVCKGNVFSLLREKLLNSEFTGSH